VQTGTLRRAGNRVHSRAMSNTKLENLTIRLDPDTREALERLAAREDRPLAYLIRRMLRAETVQRMTAEGRAA
jgi:predicted DNA-binding protein